MTVNHDTEHTPVELRNLLLSNLLDASAFDEHWSTDKPNEMVILAVKNNCYYKLTIEAVDPTDTIAGEIPFFSEVEEGSQPHPFKWTPELEKGWNRS